MEHNRRNFLKATGAISLLGASSAQAAASDPWIGVIRNSTGNLDLELAFYDGLRLGGAGFEADPAQVVGSGLKRLNVLTHHISGKYKKGTYDSIGRGVQDILDALAGSNLKAIVAVGGLIIAKGAAAKLVSTSSSLPLATIVGRDSPDVKAYANAAGFFFDNDASVTQTLSDKITELLQYPSMDPAVDAKNLWLLYNGNSEMGFDEKAAWESVITSAYHIQANSVNAALDSQNHPIENKDIKLREIFQFLKNRGAKAVVVSSDPYFTRNLQRIVRIAGAPRFANIIMCYPVMEYSDEAIDAGMGAGNYFAFGPRLTEVYSNLGALIANWIKTSTPPSQLFNRATPRHS